MADLDIITICKKCLHPVERLILCPVCGVETKKVYSVLLATLRKLRVKGWIVEDWTEKWGDDAGDGFGIRLRFRNFAPPMSATVVPEIRDLRPWVLSMHEQNVMTAYRNLYNWARDVPVFAVPFAQDFCDMCRQQGADWYFSRCYCPANEVKIAFTKHNHIRLFADGYPEKCAYAVEQVMTFENRLKQLEGYFEENPFAKRSCLRQVRKVE